MYQNKKILCVLPARLESKRFPRKVLYPFCGKPMVIHVYDRIKSSKLIDNTLVATDDILIMDTAKKYTVPCILTSKNHVSGSDRVGEVMHLKAFQSYDLIINCQADEPLIQANDLDQLIIFFLSEQVDRTIGTLSCALLPIEKENNNRVKVRVDDHGYLLDCKRLLDPKDQKFTWQKHIGIYLYTRNVLGEYLALPPSKNEQRLKLEQFRAIDAGMKFRILQTSHKLYSVDTLEDTGEVEAQLNNEIEKI